MFVIWNWESLLPLQSDEESIKSESQSTCSSEIDETMPEYHTVTFKVIGNLREHSYQTTLRKVSEYMYDEKHVEVWLMPEPDNPVDKHAIAFMCSIDDKDQRIGYVVRECLQDVHEALSRGLICKTEFAWCRYRSFRGRLGWYAAVNVTLKGKWSNAVVRSSST